jgi:hypothetical protein
VNPAVHTAVLPSPRWLLSIQLFIPLCCPLHAACCLSSCAAPFTLPVAYPAVHTAVLPSARCLLSIQLFILLCCSLHADCCLSPHHAGFVDNEPVLSIIRFSRRETRNMWGLSAGSGTGSCYRPYINTNIE